MTRAHTIGKDEYASLVWFVGTDGSSLRSSSGSPSGHRCRIVDWATKHV